MMKVGIVAGEASGDILGAGLIKALKVYFPDAKFVGVGGPAMIDQGFISLYEQERLAVMGFVEPLKRLPELLSMRGRLYRYFIEQQFDVFIGIDSPDFNLTLETRLKKQGVKTVHYVSPSVWAWRQNRIKKIARAVDLMLTLLPFENNIYEKNHVPVKFVGHPLADRFPLEPDLQEAKNILAELVPGYDKERPLLACLPGSRGGEVKLIGPLFWQALTQMATTIDQLQIIVPAANQLRLDQIREQLVNYPTLPVTVIEGNSHQVMAAADTVLLASGTTALEAMLLKKNMVVAYKLAPLSYWIMSKLLKAPYISLPNLLADQLLVPELIQSTASPKNIALAVEKQLTGDHSTLISTFTQLHQSIKGDADKNAAEAIYQLIGHANG